ncbi:MAG TPA: DUF4214 domain-containing protein [Gemmatimonadaceae bacterium]
MTDLLVAVRGSLVLRILSAVLLTCAAACSADVTTGVPASSASPQGPGFSAPSSELAKLPAVRPDSVIFGINGHPLMQPAYWFDDQTLDEQFDYLDSLRIHWYRVDMMPDPDGSLGPKFSKLMQAAARRGIHVLPVITNRPRSGQTPNEAYAEAYRMALGFASRYGQLFTHVEAGNELEGWPLWSGSRGKADGSDLSQYDADTLAVVTAWLRGLTRGLRAGAPKLRIIIDTGGWHHWAFFDALRRDTVEYDIVGYHWYSDMGDIAAPVAGGKSALDHLYALNKDIWITEINRRATIPDDPRDQNHWIYKYVRDFFGFSRVKAFFVYELYEQHAYLADDNPSNDTEALYGLVACPADPMQCTGRKVTKPAFDAYRFAIEEQLHGHEDYVASVYAHLLAREPDAKSLAHWTEVLESSNDRAALLRAFIPAGDYYERFVLGQYERLLGYDSRNGDAPPSQDVAQWADQMRSGLARRDLTLDICDSPHFWDLSGRTDRGYVERLYRTLLLRDPDAGDVAHWVGQLNEGVARRDVAARLLDSDEYHGLFVDGIYQALLDRPSDGSGRAYWVERMRSGLSQEKVILGFLEGPEFWTAAVQAGYRRISE